MLTMAAGLFSHADEIDNATQPAKASEMTLSDEQVAAFAALAFKGISQEYPNKPSNVLASPDDVKSPAAMHPVFYGCFDWHSSVHGHWMLARLLKLYPDSSVAARFVRH